MVVYEGEREDKTREIKELHDGLRGFRDLEGDGQGDAHAAKRSSYRPIIIV